MINKTFKYLTFLFAVIILYSCVESITNTSSTTKPTIRVTSPATNDTVQIGKNLITYTASDYSGGNGLDHYETFINGSPVETYAQNTDGTNPKIYLTVDSTLLNKRISYYVSVYNKDGKSATSSAKSNILVKRIIKVPDKPQNLSIQIVSDAEAIIFWSDTTKTAESFEIWRKDGKDGTYIKKKTISTGGGTQFSYRDVGLSAFTVYYYKVRGLNTVGASTFSNEVNTLNGGAPSNLTATANGATLVSLSWTDNALNENGFYVERKVVGGSFAQLTLLSQNSTEYTDRSCSPNTNYVYRIGALTDNAVAYSNEVSVTTYNTDIPAPSGLIATYDPLSNAVNIVWDDNTSMENGTQIERKDDLNPDYQRIGTVATDITSFKDLNITTGRLYTYRARFSTTEGFYTEYSNEDTVFVSVHPPNQPTNLNITATSDSKVFTLDWVDNSTDEDGFEIWAKKGISGTWALFPPTLPANLIADSVRIADPTSEYFFKIRAFKGNMNSEFSNIVSTKGSSGVLKLELVTAQSTYVEIRWQDVFEGEVLFIVERKKTSFPADSDFVEIDRTAALPGVGGYQNYIDTQNIASFENYLYRVRAKFSTTYSDYSNELVVTVP